MFGIGVSDPDNQKRAGETPQQYRLRLRRERVSGPSAAPEPTPDERLATIAREQHEQYVETYLPVEQELLARTRDPDVVRKGIERATELVGAGFDVAGETRAREMRRYGIGLTDERRARLESASGREEALQTVGAQNIVRSGTVDRRRAGTQELVASGRGLQASATQAATTAAGMAASRNIVGQQAQAAKRAAAIGTAATGAGLGAYIGAGTSVGGPAGAALGLGLGLLVGYLE